MVSADMLKYAFDSVFGSSEFSGPLKDKCETRSEPLHTTKNEQQAIKELEIKAEQLEGNSYYQAGEERGEESSKRPKLEVNSELQTVRREIRLRKFALKVARSAFAQFMLGGEVETLDLSDVVDLARETCMDETDTSMEVSEGLLKELVESMLAMFGLYIKQSDNWNFQMGFC